MKSLLLVGAFVVFVCVRVRVRAASGSIREVEERDLPAAEDCDPVACQLPGCRCSSTAIPGGLAREQTPQFVILTFDDAVTVSNTPYYRNAFYNRRNPDGCAISATFFMSHEYTDYSLIHELHASGFEIGLHSITHSSSTDYWRSASAELLKREFADQAILTSHFANIPQNDMKGIRLPLLQMNGNNSFQMMSENNLLYDLSWGTQNYVNPGLWPYTLDYRSIQECLIPPCPTASIPGAWVAPALYWRDSSGYHCAMVDACYDIPSERVELFEYMKSQFHRHYDGNRSPFGVYLHSAWFLIQPNGYDAYLDLLDYMGSLNDVYIVNVQQLLNWVRNPVPLLQLPDSGWSKCPKRYAPRCNAITCQLFRRDGNNVVERWMRFCGTTCPMEHPWLNNPFGKNVTMQNVL